MAPGAAGSDDSAGGTRKVFGQAIRFGLVGVVNGIIDFGTFSVLRTAGVPIVPANLVSTTCGMAFSFFANRKFVFVAEGDGKRQLVLFLAGTAFSMYVLQSLVILGVTRLAPGLLDFAADVAVLVGLDSERSALLIRSNTAKLIATAVSLTWNFVFYRTAVFRENGR